MYAGCNYVLHSSGQLFSHKRKHERRFWEYSAPSKQPKLQVTSAATSAEATACDSDAAAAAAAADAADAAAAVPSASITTLTAVCDAHSSLTLSTVTSCGPVNGSNAPAGETATARPPPVSKPSAVSLLATQNSSVNDEPVASTSTDEIGETKTQEAVASTSLDSSQPDRVAENVDSSATRRSPDVITVDDDEVPATTSFPVHHEPTPLNVVDRSSSSGELTAHLDDAKLEKLERKEFVDLEDLAEMTRLKQIADEKKTGSESQQSAQYAANVIVASCGINNTTAPTHDVTSTSASAPAALPVMPSKSNTTIKCLRSGVEKKERDDSWQNYIKRSAAVSLRE